MGVGEPNAGRTIAMVALSLAIGGALLGAAAMPTVAGFSPIGDPLERTAPGSLVDAEDDPAGVEGVDGPDDDQLRRSGDRTAGAEGAEGTAAAGGEASAIAENAAAAEAAAYGLAALFAAMGGSEEDVAAAAARSGASPETIEAAAGSEGEIDPADFDGAGAEASGPLDAPLSPDGFDGELGGLYGDVPAQDREIGLDGSADPGAVDSDGDVGPDDVDAGAIDPDDVDADDVDADDVEAGDLDSDDIDADDVDTDDVDAGGETDAGDDGGGDDRGSGADDGTDGTDDGGTEGDGTDTEGVDGDGTDADESGDGGTDADGTDEGGTDTGGTDETSDGQSADDDTADDETDRETGGTDDADDDARGSLDLGDDGEESEATPSDSDDAGSGEDGGDAADPEADTDDEALSDGVPGGDRAPTIALLALAALALGYVFLRKDEPIAYLLAIPRRLGAVALAVLVACSNALERAVSALARVTSIAELPGVIVAGVLAAIGGARRRVRETTASLNPFASDDEGAVEAEAATARERIADAWEIVVAASSVYRARVRTSTPASVARRAKERGAPAGAVEEITEAFRDVEYGGYDPNPRVEPVSEAEDELRASLRAREDEE